VEAFVEAALRLAAPLLLAALGELLVERAGVVNIGVEGMMLVGAFAAWAVAVETGSPWWGVAAAPPAAGLLALVFVAFALRRGADQIVVGTALNLLALGLTGAVYRGRYGALAPEAPLLPSLEFGLSGPEGAIPEALARPSLFAVAAAIAFVLLSAGLRLTRPGLRLHAVGESAHAAAAEGVRVLRLRTAAVLLGAMLAGLGGAALSVSLTTSFSEGMSAGRGFIALAVVIFGRWRPGGVLLGALFFGAATALQFRMQARGLDVPYPVLLMLPYVLTLAVLLVATGRARAPADLGRPYRP